MATTGSGERNRSDRRLNGAHLASKWKRNVIIGSAHPGHKAPRFGEVRASAC
jgi:hypothetical protein